MFVKISNQFINTDQIVKVEDYGVLGESRAVDIYTTATEAGTDAGSPAPYTIRLFGKDAEAFIRWISLGATDLTSDTEEAEQFRYYREAGGDMLFSEWLSVWKRHKSYIARDEISPYEGELRL